MRNKVEKVKSMDIAKRIRELRESVGENRSEFSRHTGIPVRTVNQLNPADLSIYHFETLQKWSLYDEF